MGDYKLQREIKMLIDTKREGDYWDFKESHHINKADLLHDIICMANNRVDRDAYIIYGVEDKSHKTRGVKDDPNRRNQQCIIDILSSKKFFNGLKPSIELRTIDIDKKEVDVLIIKNSTDTPYYLIERYRDKEREVKAYHIYTRLGDTNTAIDKSADANHVEYLWKKRFLLNRSPLEQIVKRLKNKDEWKESNTGFYNIYNPEFTISIEDEDDDLEAEFYSYAMTNESTSYQNLTIKYFQTKLYYEQVVVLDSGRYITSVPEWGCLYFGEYKSHPDYFFKFYIKESIVYKLQEFLFNNVSEEAISAKRRFDDVVLTFENKLEKELFIEYVYENKVDFDSQLDEREDSYNYLTNIAHKQDIVRLKVGEVLNKMLKEFRGK